MVENFFINLTISYNFIHNYLFFLFIWFIVATLWLTFLPLRAEVYSLNKKSKSIYYFKQFILICSYLNFFIFLFIWYQHDYLCLSGYMELLDENFIRGLIQQNSLIGFSGSMLFGVDTLNLYFLLLTTFIAPFCFLSAFESINFHLIPYILLFLILVLGVILTFLTFNLFYFYFFFEIILIPMFFLIGFWGSSTRRTLAAFYFFFFTMFGSLFLIIAIILLSFEVDDLYVGDLVALTQILVEDEFFNDLSFLLLYYNDAVLDIRFISHFVIFDSELQLVFWWLFFLPFAIKIPMYPFHIWLPEAHVEAPTSGSMFLAAILLKLGSYGFLRFMVPLFPFANIYYSPFFLTLSIISVFYSSFTALRQIDIKRIIAYSSIAHMNFAILGIFNNDIYGYCGSILIFIGHGFISAALFFLVGVVYDRYKTRLVFYYSGLVMLMPLYGIFFFFFSLGNVAFPGTVNFIGELFILISVLQVNFFIFWLSGLTLFFSLLFTFWLFTRLIFGIIRLYNNSLFFDLTKLEFYVLIFFLIVMFLFGLQPNIIFDLLEFYVWDLLANSFSNYYESSDFLDVTNSLDEADNVLSPNFDDTLNLGFDSYAGDFNVDDLDL